MNKTFLKVIDSILFKICEFILFLLFIFLVYEFLGLSLYILQTLNSVVCSDIHLLYVQSWHFIFYPVSILTWISMPLITSTCAVGCWPQYFDWVFNWFEEIQNRNLCLISL